MTRGERGDDIYLDSLYVALAAIPGTLISILTVNIVGAKAMLGMYVDGLYTCNLDKNRTEKVSIACFMG